MKYKAGAEWGTDTGDGGLVTLLLEALSHEVLSTASHSTVGSAAAVLVFGRLHYLLC